MISYRVRDNKCNVYLVEGIARAVSTGLRLAREGASSIDITHNNIIYRWECCFKNIISGRYLKRKGG